MVVEGWGIVVSYQFDICLLELLSQNLTKLKKLLLFYFINLSNATEGVFRCGF